MDEVTFAEKVTALERSLYCVAMGYLGNQHDCADAVQEAIIKAWQSLDKLRQADYFKTWITRIVINECLTMLRKKKRVVLTESFPDLPTPPPDADAGLFDALFEMDVKYRIVIILHYRDGYTLEEMSKTLGVPVSTVKTRMFRARKQLQVILKDEEVCFT